MWTKLASVAALFSSAAALTACTTSAGKPVEVKCLPAFVMKNRCPKVPYKVKEANRATPIMAAPAKPKAERRSARAMDVYGQSHSR